MDLDGYCPPWRDNFTMMSLIVEAIIDRECAYYNKLTHPVFMQTSGYYRRLDEKLHKQQDWYVRYLVKEI